jgi:hypothetical protein
VSVAHRRSSRASGLRASFPSQTLTTLPASPQVLPMPLRQSSWWTRCACLWVVFGGNLGSAAIAQEQQARVSDVKVPPADDRADLDDIAWRGYHDAFRLLLAGERSDALALLKLLLQRYPTHPSAAMATQVTRLLEAPEKGVAVEATTSAMPSSRAEALAWPRPRRWATRTVRATPQPISVAAATHVSRTRQTGVLVVSRASAKATPASVRTVGRPVSRPPRAHTNHPRSTCRRLAARHRRHARWRAVGVPWPSLPASSVECGSACVAVGGRIAPHPLGKDRSRTNHSSPPSSPPCLLPRAVGLLVGTMGATSDRGGFHPKKEEEKENGDEGEKRSSQVWNSRVATSRVRPFEAPSKTAWFEVWADVGPRHGPCLVAGDCRLRLRM